MSFYVGPHSPFDKYFTSASCAQSFVLDAIDRSMNQGASSIHRVYVLVSKACQVLSAIKKNKAM